MIETSKDGVQILRALALAVRAEQDFDLLPPDRSVVGALKDRDAMPSDAIEAKRRFGHKALLKLDDYRPLHLREALNKIAHADPRVADFYVAPTDSAHDLLLYGDNRGLRWFAAVSVLDLVKVIRALPDREMDQHR